MPSAFRSKAFVLLFCALSPAAYTADHLRPGLWEAIMVSRGPGAPVIVPEQFANSRRLGLRPRRDGGLVFHQCITADARLAGEPRSAARAQNCRFIDRKASGSTTTATEECRGELRGRGEVSMTFDSETHYTAHRHFSGVRTARGVADVDTVITGTWMAADCRQ